VSLKIKLCGVMLFINGCSLPEASSPPSFPKNGDFIVVSPDANYQGSKIVLFDPLTQKSETLLGGESGDVLVKIFGDRLYLFNRQKGRSSFSYLSRNQNGNFVRSVEIQTPMTDQSDPVDVLRSNNGQMILAMWTRRDVVRFDEATPGNAFGLSSNKSMEPNERDRSQSLRPAFFLNNLNSKSPTGLIDSQEAINIVYQSIDDQWKSQGDGAILSLSNEQSTWHDIPLSNPVSLLNVKQGYLLGGVCYSSMGAKCRSGLYRFSDVNVPAGNLIEFDSSEWEPNGGVFEGFDESHVFACGRALKSENLRQSHLLKISTSTGKLLEKVELPSSLCGGSTYSQSPSGEKVLYLGITIPGKGGQFLVYDQSMKQVSALDLDYSVGSFVVFNK
jgi:hypothetical protein